MFGWKRAPRVQAGPPPAPRQRSMPIPLKDHDDATSFKNASGAAQSPPEPTMPAPEFSRARSIRSADSLRRLVNSAVPAADRAAQPENEPTSKEKQDLKDSAQNEPAPSAGVSMSSASSKPGSDSADGTEGWTWKWLRGAPDTSTKAKAASDTKNNHSADRGASSSAATPAPSADPSAKPTSTAGSQGPGGQDPTSQDPGSQDQATQNDKEGGSWGFWSRRSRPGAEDGDLAITGTESASRPRPAEVHAPASKRARPAKPSLLLPQLETLPLQTRTDRFTKLFWPGPPRMLRTSPPRVRKAVVVGVHGYFPARVTRAILGEPTGTSLKFASEAEREVQRWLAEHMAGNDDAGSEVQIEQIALEGEGRIKHRVDSLYALLLNWEAMIRDADLVFFAVHSQGTVVALHIVARLIAEGKLSPRAQRVAILGMAGSLLGPMPGMDQTLVMKAITRIEHDSLIELFELQHQDSQLSRDLRRDLAVTLGAGVKVTLVGSADDMLIPLYSALAVHVQHPNLFRAVYFDGDDVSPTVAAPLLNIAVQQMNAGATDRGVITELSGPLAGALTSKGHSKLYSHSEVYRLGVRVALETSFISGVAPEFDRAFKIPRPTANPYLLPWATQALVTEALQNERLLPILADLVHQYENWRPTTKPMKDLKWRLAGLRDLARSKL